MTDYLPYWLQGLTRWLLLPLLYLATCCSYLYPAGEVEEAAPLQDEAAYRQACSWLDAGQPEVARHLFLQLLHGPIVTSSMTSQATAYGVVVCTQERLASSVRPLERVLLAERLSSDLRQLLAIDQVAKAPFQELMVESARLAPWHSPRTAERQKQLTSQLLSTEDKQERSAIHLELALEGYYGDKNLPLFRAHSQQLLAYEKEGGFSAEESRWLHDLLFHLSHQLAFSSSVDPVVQRQYLQEAASHLLLLYPSPIEELFLGPRSDECQISRQLADLLWQNQPQLAPLLPMEAPPKELVEAAERIARLYSIAFIPLESWVAIDGSEPFSDRSMQQLDRALQLSAALQNLPMLEALTRTCQRHAKVPIALKAKAESLTAYFYEQYGHHWHASLLTAAHMARPEPWTAGLATLTFAKAGWRQLAAEQVSDRERYQPFLQLLGLLATCVIPENEPLHTEAAIEYALAATAADQCHPDASILRTMALGHVRQDYFQWQTGSHPPPLSRLPHQSRAVAGYRQLLEAHTLSEQGMTAKAHGHFEEMIDHHRRAIQIYSNLVGNEQFQWPYLQTEAERGRQRLLE